MPDRHSINSMLKLMRIDIVALALSLLATDARDLELDD